MILEGVSTSAERIPVQIVNEQNDAIEIIAKEIIELIVNRQEKNQNVVLGLATGSSPIILYKKLVKAHQEQGVSFKNVITFNLDEYFPISPESSLSYRFFMNYHLFSQIDIPSENINIPIGDLDQQEITSFCNLYEKKIKDLGGIDIQILGIGRSGHIGFNEPGSRNDSVTRLVKLHPITILDAKREFIHESEVPRRAITMGIKTILEAKKIFVLAWGESKASILKELVEGSLSEEVPATFLQQHKNVAVFVDHEASIELTRIKTPWLVSLCDWSNEKLVYTAIIWLSNFLKKPILKLTEEDYQKNDLGDLLANFENVQEVNLRAFNKLQRTITGWPGGKPGSNDSTRPERAEPRTKRVIVFSPHPDDDVISMGGTLIKLAEQGHEVHVVYQTSGNIAVHDEDVIRYADFLTDFITEQGIQYDAKDLKSTIEASFRSKKPGAPDIQIVRDIKRLIRKEEARAGARFCGIIDENIHFMNLPFYESGSIEKNPISQIDIQKTIQILEQIKPHQIFAAGDLRDPHGTHETCLDIIYKSLRSLREKKISWLNDCYLWLYRGAWQEWPTEQIEMAIPLSPSDLLKKKMAIFKHQSQKDAPVFPGADKREFWQRAEDRNRDSAINYDRLGLTEYEAIEAFVRGNY